ncbi:MAG: cupin domain-containing protein [Gemmatimonadaceae bacterium]
MAFIDYDSISPRDIVPGFTARFVHGERMTLARVQVKRGAALPQHSHPHEQLTTLISGELELTLGGETQVLRAGMLAVIPSGVPHSARALADCEVIDVFQPVREDYR